MHENEHMHRLASTHVYTPVLKRTRAQACATLTLMSRLSHVRTQTGRQPPAGQQAEHSNNLPQATCSSSPQWEEEET